MKQVLVPRCVYAGLEEGVMSYAIPGFRDRVQRKHIVLLFPCFLKRVVIIFLFCCHPKPEWHL